VNSAENSRPWFDSDQARRIHFFVPLQDPVALPDGASFVKQLGIEVGTVRDALPLLVEPPDSDVDLDGNIFPAVHIIFHRIDGRGVDFTPITRTVEAVQRRLGVRQDETVRIRGEVQALENSTDSANSWWSIAEMIFEDYGLTPELGPAQRRGEQPDWFMLSLEALAEVIRAYRIATKSPIQEVNYSRLPPVMVAITVPMLGRGAEGTPDAAYYTLNSWGGQWIEVQSDNLDTESVLDYTTRLAQRLSVSDPLLTYTDRMWRARRALEVESEFDSAVLRAAIAVEAYLVALWLHLQWEKGEGVGSALSRVGQLGGKKPTKTILSWLGQDLEECGALSRMPESPLGWMDSCR
jgi:hypothetical protein